MANGIMDFLGKVPIIGDTIKGLTGQPGLETGAAGARAAQEQAKALSELQWQRQMQGLDQARGQTQPYLSLYDKIYGTKTAGQGMPGPGGGGMPGPMMTPGRSAEPRLGDPRNAPPPPPRVGGYQPPPAWMKGGGTNNGYQPPPSNVNDLQALLKNLGNTSRPMPWR